MIKMIKNFFELKKMEGVNLFFGSFLKIPHKHWEFQFQTNRWNDSHDYFDFSIRWSRKGDHAGFKFDLTLLGIFIEFNIYDDRHWDYDRDRYMTEKEHKEEWAEELEDE